MKHLILSLMVACSFLHAADGIPLMDKVPSMRGVPGDPAWQGALKITDFKGNRPEQDNGKVTVWIGRTADTLYAALLSEHAKTDAFHRDQTAHDGEIYRDDDFEIFLDFRGKKKDYVLIIGNSNGAVLDLYVDPNRRQHTDYESGAVVRGSVQNNSYYIEAAIPLASLRLGENETGMIGLCLGRTIAWNKDTQSCFGKFHEPNTWKNFQIPFETPLILKKASCNLTAGKQPFRFELSNISTQKMDLTLDLSGTKRTVTIPAHGSQVFTLDVLLKSESEPVHKTLKVLDQSGKTMLQWGVFGKVNSSFEAVLQSFVLYNGEDARLDVTFNSRISEPMSIQSVSQDGKILARKTLLADSEKMDTELTVPTGTAYVLCKYGAEQKKFPVRIIQSPWEK